MGTSPLTVTLSALSPPLPATGQDQHGGRQRAGGQKDQALPR